MTARTQAVAVGVKGKVVSRLSLQMKLCWEVDDWFHAMATEDKAKMTLGQNTTPWPRVSE